MKTIVGMYDDVSELDSLIEPLMRSGVKSDHVEVICHGKTRDRFRKDSEHSNLSHEMDVDSVQKELERRGVPTADARFFQQGLRQGNSLLVVEAEEDQASHIVEHLQNGKGASGRTGQSKASSKTQKTKKSNGSSGASKTASRGQTSSTRGDKEASETFPVVEEELKVQKEVRERGGVEIERSVETQRVQKDIDLEEEHVDVSRKKTDRRPSKAEMKGAFEEGTMEMHEHEEKLHVEKEPRVVEEVAVKKTTERKTEQIDETLRRLDVDIQEIDSKAASHLKFGACRDIYRKHFEKNFSDQNETFDTYETAYQYGHAHGVRDDWKSHDWNTVEPQLREDYEKRNGKGSWKRNKDAVKHAFNNVRAKSRS